MKRIVVILCLLCTGYWVLYAQESGTAAMQRQGKLKAIRSLRNHYARELAAKDNSWKPLMAEIDSLRPDGSFADIHDSDIVKGDTVLNDSLLAKVFMRLWSISEALRDNRWTIDYNRDTWERCQKAILRYGEMETGRPGRCGSSMVSCSEIPLAAVNIYFCHLRLMEKAEQDSLAAPALKSTCGMLKKLAARAWPDSCPKSGSGANLVFSGCPLWQAAIMHCSVEMMDSIAEECRRGIMEGFTADGLCHAYSRQTGTGEESIQNIFKVLDMLKILRNTPWGGMSRELSAVLVNYFRGSSFYYYKGYEVPCTGQNTMLYQPGRKIIGYWELLKALIIDWEDAFTKADFKELKQLYIEAQGYDPQMYRNPYYSGTRWFFNNDDLIKKTRRYHLTVNMTSARCDSPGGELRADAYNHFSADGATLFQKTGTEYQKVFGAFDITAFPGVTAREGMKYITPATGRQGYCSKHNFAAGATSGGANAAAGFRYEKIPLAERGKEGTRRYYMPEEVMLYGVKAHKSYFILGDYLVALGAGITDKVPDVRRRIRTTIDQTEWRDSVYLYRGNGIDWVIHKGQFAYSVFPAYQENAYHVCETKKTRWTMMNLGNSRVEGLPEKVGIFRMWIDHGHHPLNDAYGYAVYAGEGMPPREYPFEVLRNDTLVQAVKSKDNHVIGAVFYDAGTELNARGVSLKVSSPCAVLVEKQDGYLILSVADALMDEHCKQIDVTLNNRKFTLKMPRGKLCGQPSVYRRRLSDQ